MFNNFNNIFKLKLDMRSPERLAKVYDVVKLENLCAGVVSFINRFNVSEDRDNANANLKNYRKALDILNKNITKGNLK